MWDSAGPGSRVCRRGRLWPRSHAGRRWRHFHSTSLFLALVMVAFPRFESHGLTTEAIIDVNPGEVVVEYGGNSAKITCLYKLVRDPFVDDDGRRENDARDWEQVSSSSSSSNSSSSNSNSSSSSGGEGHENATDMSVEWSAEIGGPTDSDYGAAATTDSDDDSSNANHLRNTRPPRASVAKVTFYSTPDIIYMKLFDYNLDGYVMIKPVEFRALVAQTLELSFQLRNVRQSGRFGCELGGFGVRSNRMSVQVYVKTTDVCEFTKRHCREGTAERRTTTLCIDGSCVCQPRHQRWPDQRRRTTDCQPNLSSVVVVDDVTYVAKGLERDCYVCYGTSPSSRFMTALIVTLLVLVSGAMSVVGVAILYDWLKRYRDLTELEREHTEPNTTNAVDIEALRRVENDRPPSYVETRRSDLHLAGAPPPSYEGVCGVAASGKNVATKIMPDQGLSRCRNSPTTTQPTEMAHAVSVTRLAAGPAGSVLTLEPIAERRISL
ncbi:hypothetical protein BIW11_12708 [Tropilaelaps mercedesae]|uniref:Uncharacterized protein n=1 Tax=Tropilaelaps mercedesae TaxID=418985 RepID=A0A1V9X587_9ACAR|nr:hypothetical protein BIW11_12708 [Tropilaelaps mercedesae]